MIRVGSCILTFLKGLLIPSRPRAPADLGIGEMATLDKILRRIVAGYQYTVKRLLRGLTPRNDILMGSMGLGRTRATE